MSPLIPAIEHLNYRVTVGDLATHTGLSLQDSQRQLLDLASQVGAHLQVSEGGEIAYLFPRHLGRRLAQQSWRRRWRQGLQRIWRLGVYLVRISFGILLIASLVLITIAIIALVVAASAASRQGDEGDRDWGGGWSGGPSLQGWFSPEIFWIFDFNRWDRRPAPPPGANPAPLNFLEAVFSVLFGDGNPNGDLEERRWRAIAAVVQAQGGVVVAEQIMPFLDQLGQGWSRELEDYMVPVLSRFNGVPQVSPGGGIVYHFPELQVTAAARRRLTPPAFLKELPWRFSQASSGQVIGALGLGSANLIGALVLGSLLQDQTLVAQVGGVVALVNSLYWGLLGYGSAFLAIPLGRYLWLQGANRRIQRRNQERQGRSAQLRQDDPTLSEKLSFAQTLVGQTIVTDDNLAYTTETDLIDQEAANREKLDEEWRQRLSRRQP
jgi:hypothetical protein